MKNNEKNKKQQTGKEVKMQADSEKVKGLLNIQELSEILGVKVATIYGWVSEGFIPHIKLGRLVRFDLDAIYEWVSKKQRKGRDSRLPKENFLF